MEYLVGISMAVGIGVFASAVGLDRERGFYPVVLCVVASYYALFAVIGGSFSVLALETWIAFGFVALAVWGFKRSLWLVVAGLFGHGAMDLIHPQILANPGEPVWWPGFCMAYDMVAAGCLGWKLLAARGQPRGASRTHVGLAPGLAGAGSVPGGTVRARRTSPVSRLVRSWRRY